MPIDTTGFTDGLKTVFTTVYKSDSDDATTAATETIQLVADAWSELFTPYVQVMIPPPTVVPGILEAAEVTLNSSLVGLFSATNPTITVFATSLSTIIGAWAAQLPAGIGPTYASVAPLAPALQAPLTATLVSFETALNAGNPPEPEDVAEAIAGDIDTWLKTGTSTLVAPPNTVLTWS